MYKGKSAKRPNGIASLLAGLGFLLILGLWSIVFGVPESAHRFAGWLFLLIGAISMSCLGLWWLYSDYRSRIAASVSINSTSRAEDLQARHVGEMVEASSNDRNGSASYPPGYVPLQFADSSKTPPNRFGFETTARRTMFSPLLGAVLILGDPWQGQGSSEMTLSLHYHPAFVGLPKTPAISSSEFRADLESHHLAQFSLVGRSFPSNRYVVRMHRPHINRMVEFPNGTSTTVSELCGGVLTLIASLEVWELYRQSSDSLEFAVPEEVTSYVP